MYITFTNHVQLSRFVKSYSWKQSILIFSFELIVNKKKNPTNLNLNAETVLLYLSSSKQCQIIVHKKADQLKSSKNKWKYHMIGIVWTLWKGSSRGYHPRQLNLTKMIQDGIPFLYRCLWLINYAVIYVLNYFMIKLNVVILTLNWNYK